MSSSSDQCVSSGNDASRSTSMSLLAHVKANEGHAWQRLSDLHGPLVYDWCRKSGLGAEDAADVVQEVFRSVVVSIAKFQKECEADTFRGWLRTITRNKILDHIKALRNKPQAVGGTDAYTRLVSLPEPLETSEEDTATFSSASPLLRRALDMIQGEFNQRTWSAFWLGIFTERSAADIGAELGMTANAVRLAKGRVLRRLREEIADPFAEEPGNI
jgi:RNA polymerase sigma-70 factor (ECF subfamily)